MIVKDLLNSKEVDLVTKAVLDPKGVVTKSYSRDDGGGLKSKLCLWNKTGQKIPKQKF